MIYLLAIGFAAGLVLGIAIRRESRGCLALLAAPLVTIAYLVWSQLHNPDASSTAPISWPFMVLFASMSAFGGFAIGRVIIED